MFTTSHISNDEPYGVNHHRWILSEEPIMIFELTADITREFVFVNHAFGHGQKGAIGILIVDE